MSDTEEHSAAAQMNHDESLELPAPPAEAHGEEHDAAAAESDVEAEQPEQPAANVPFDIVSQERDKARWECSC